MRFERLDLNLLVALDALLSERSVSLAADRLCLSQSAASSALSRLRQYFGDDLMVLNGRQMTLTLRAEQLREPVRAALDQIRKTITNTPEFQPHDCEQQIRIMASDYVIDVFLCKILNRIAILAPKIRVDLLAMHDSPLDCLERQAADLVISLDYALSPDHPSRFLFEDDHVVIAWDQNPAAQVEIDLETYLTSGHVVARFGKNRVPAFEDGYARRMKQPRRVEVVAPSFLVLGALVTGTNRLATVHRRLAERLIKTEPLVVRELPFFVPPIREAIQWHNSNSKDPALIWIINKIAEFSEEL